MKWFVYRHLYPQNRILEYDVFSHERFYHDVVSALQKCDTKEKFEKELHHIAFYYYASKCEHEIVLSEWVGPHTNRKVDIYMQLHLNWNVFVDYIWRHKNG